MSNPYKIIRKHYLYHFIFFMSYISGADWHSAVVFKKNGIYSPVSFSWWIIWYNVQNAKLHFCKDPAVFEDLTPNESADVQTTELDTVSSLLNIWIAFIWSSCNLPSSEMTIINGYPVSQKVWHAKELSLLNGNECRA